MLPPLSLLNVENYLKTTQKIPKKYLKILKYVHLLPYPTYCPKESPQKNYLNILGIKSYPPAPS